MAEDDFIQEGYDLEGDSFNSSITINGNSSNDQVGSSPKSEIKNWDLNKERKPVKRAYTKHKVISNKEVHKEKQKKISEVVKKEPIKEKKVTNKIEPNENKNSNNGKKEQITNKRSKKTNYSIALLAIIAIIAISIFIVNIGKIFPDKGSPVAIVNGDIISTKDIEATLKTVPAIYRPYLTEEIILNQTITNKLLMQEAKKAGISVTDDEIQEAIDASIENAQTTREEFEAYLEDQNLTINDLEEFYKMNLAIQKLLENTAYKNINITDSDVVKFYNNNSKLLVNLTFEQSEEQIRDFLLQKEQAKAFNSYVGILISKANIVILNKEEPTATTTSTFNSSYEVEKYSSCAVKNNIPKNSVIFFYSESCPHCQRMKPIVTELGDSGSFFKWFSASDSSAVNTLRTCFSDVLAGGVPQFICAKNGQTIVGETSKEELKAFADSCK